jgi:hypothetical protein
MSRPGIERGPLRWEASTLEKSHLTSLLTLNRAAIKKCIEWRLQVQIAF